MTKMMNMMFVMIVTIGVDRIWNLLQHIPHLADNEVGDSSEVITDEEVAKAQLGKEENNPESNINDDADEADEANEADKSEAMKRCKVILSEIDGIESEIETAIEVEEYDLAAELDEKDIKSQG